MKELSVSVFSPRVVGVAVARYDFCSRDTQELSLLQGDIIKIYTKMSSGWWKGEVDGRVGRLYDPVTVARFCARSVFLCHLCSDHISSSHCRISLYIHPTCPCSIVTRPIDWTVPSYISLC